MANIVRFATTDGGYVFVDQDTNKVVRVEKGTRRELPEDTQWAKDPGRGFNRDPGVVIGQRALDGLAQNNRGNSVVLTPQDGSQSFNVLQSMSKNEEGEMASITCGFDIVGADNDVDVSDIYGIVATGSLEWGVGGALYQAEFDWMRGTILRVPANFVRVGVTVLSKIVAVTYNMRFSASIAYGGSNNKSQTARKTLAFGGVSATGYALPTSLAAGATSDKLLVPNFATGLTIVATDTFGSVAQPAYPALVRQYSTTSAACRFVTANRITNTSNQYNIQDGVIPLINGTRYIDLTNESANTMYAFAIFSLAL